MHYVRAYGANFQKQGHAFSYHPAFRDKHGQVFGKFLVFHGFVILRQHSPRYLVPRRHENGVIKRTRFESGFVWIGQVL